jgi:hypothetical protein
MYALILEVCLLIKIKIDNRIVRNKNISNGAFVLYAELVYLKFVNKNSESVLIHHKLLMKYLNWHDKRKLKKYFKELYNHKLIKEEIKTFPKYKQILVTLINYNSNNFTWLPDNLIKNIKLFGDIGFRLIYYYKSFINDNEISIQYAFPSLNTIAKDLGITENTVVKYNYILEKFKLIKIDKHELVGKFKNNNTEKYFTKYNNYYYINIEKILGP